MINIWRKTIQTQGKKHELYECLTMEHTCHNCDLQHFVYSDTFRRADRKWRASQDFPRLCTNTFYSPLWRAHNSLACNDRTCLPLRPACTCIYRWDHIERNRSRRRGIHSRCIGCRIRVGRSRVYNIHNAVRRCLSHSPCNVRRDPSTRTASD